MKTSPLVIALTLLVLSSALLSRRNLPPLLLLGHTVCVQPICAPPSCRAQRNAIVRSLHSRRACLHSTGNITHRTNMSSTFLILFAEKKTLQRQSIQIMHSAAFIPRLNRHLQHFRALYCKCYTSNETNLALCRARRPECSECNLRRLCVYHRNRRRTAKSRTSLTAQATR